MANTWFTADTHFGHDRLIELDRTRFGSIREHDDFLVDRWNSVVAPGDVVYHLGDVAWRMPALDEHVRRLNGRKVLIAGNHDLCWTNRSTARNVRRARRMVGRYVAAGFDEVISSGRMVAVMAGHPVMLSHLPADGDHAGMDRYADRRPAADGLPVVCGHVHGEWRTFGRQVNVGVDVWGFAPVHVDDVVDVLTSLPGVGGGVEPVRPAVMAG